MPVDLTVADLIADPILDTSVVAGASGLHRTVRWAQTSEVAAPWTWLGPGELLMTVGLNLPADAEAQREFVRRACAAGIAGMTIGQDGFAPPLTEAMQEEADALGFPVLTTGPSTPFVVIARTVAAATASQQNRSVLVLSRLYQAAGQQDPAAKRSGRWVTDLCGARVAVVDTATGATVIGEDLVAGREHVLSTVRPTRLLVEVESDVDALTLIHLKQILAVDANVVLQDALAAVSTGEAHLRLALNGLTHKHDVDTGAWLAADSLYRVVAATEDALERLALTLALTGTPPLVTRWKNATVILAGGADLDRIRAVLGRLDLPGGSSTEQATIADLPGAVEEALTALADAVVTSQPWVTFRGTRVSLLARSRSEAERIIAAVLGPLAEESRAGLRESLFALLANDLNWQITAQQLDIHRQTLAYRLRQVESLTGRSVRRVADLSELWLAHEAWRSLHP